MTYKIFDKTRGHTVDCCEAYDSGSYGDSNAPDWYGTIEEANEIAERLSADIGNLFVVEEC